MTKINQRLLNEYRIHIQICDRAIENQDIETLQALYASSRLVSDDLMARSVYDQLYGNQPYYESFIECIVASREFYEDQVDTIVNNQD